MKGEENARVAGRGKDGHQQHYYVMKRTQIYRELSGPTALFMFIENYLRLWH